MVSLLYVALAAEVAFESPPPPSWSRCPVWIGGDVSKLTACNGRGGPVASWDDSTVNRCAFARARCSAKHFHVSSAAWASQKVRLHCVAQTPIVGQRANGVDASVNPSPARFTDGQWSPC